MEYPVEAKITKFILEAEKKLLPKIIRESSMEATYVAIKTIETPEEIPTSYVEHSDCTVFYNRPPIHKNIEGYDVIIQIRSTSRYVDTIDVFISNGNETVNGYEYHTTTPSFMFLLNQVDMILKNGFKK